MKSARVSACESRPQRVARVKKSGPFSRDETHLRDRVLFSLSQTATRERERERETRDGERSGSLSLSLSFEREREGETPFPVGLGNSPVVVLMMGPDTAKVLGDGVHPGGACTRGPRDLSYSFAQSLGRLWSDSDDLWCFGQPRTALHPIEPSLGPLISTLGVCGSGSRRSGSRATARPRRAATGSLRYVSRGRHGE